jgi:Mn-dependent DtxR family transcriptional regulator
MSPYQKKTLIDIYNDKPFVMKYAKELQELHFAIVKNCRASLTPAGIEKAEELLKM